MPYDNLRKGRYSEQQRAYFVTSVLAERENGISPISPARVL